MFFFLLQTEQGDIFKITMEVDEDMVSIYFACCQSDGSPGFFNNKDV